MQDYFRWHPSWTYLAHLFKGIVRQHHKEDIPALQQNLSADGFVFDVGVNNALTSNMDHSLGAGQFKSLAKANIDQFR
jgi:hypothetical protein